MRTACRHAAGRCSAGWLRTRSASLRLLIVSANAHEYAPGGGDTLHDGFVTKPVNLDALLAELQAQLRLEWQLQAEAPVAPERVEVPPALLGRIDSHLEDLWQLGQIGHVRGIQARLREFEAVDPACVRRWYHMLLVDRFRHETT